MAMYSTSDTRTVETICTSDITAAVSLQHPRYHSNNLIHVNPIAVSLQTTCRTDRDDARIRNTGYQPPLIVATTNTTRRSPFTAGLQYLREDGYFDLLSNFGSTCECTVSAAVGRTTISMWLLPQLIVNPRLTPSAYVVMSLEDMDPSISSAKMSTMITEYLLTQNKTGRRLQKKETPLKR